MNLLPYLTGYPQQASALAEYLQMPLEAVYEALVSMEAEGLATTEPDGHSSNHRRGWVLGWAAYRRAA